MRRLLGIIAGLALLLGPLSIVNATASGPNSAVSLASNFPHSTAINHPLYPLRPGTLFIYAGTSGGVPAHEQFLVTHQTKVISGVTCVVVHDSNWVGGQLTEFTIDWFAQDKAGNVWYFGEFATQYANGVITGHEGSWQAGVHGARQGIIMEAAPQVGDSYDQENAPGVAQDHATVLSLTQSITVTYGTFAGNVLQTQETSVLDPGVTEQKYYVPSVGNVESLDVAGGADQSQLIDVLTGQ
jgi:hypothetical protein